MPNEDQLNTNKKSEITDNQTNNRPWLFKKGQSGNPAGRPPGKSLKEYARAMLAAMTDEEREESRLALDLSTKIEREYDEEDEAMMIRLIKVRDALWT